MNRKTIILPIEVYKREFLGKLLLALHGANCGYEVYLFDQATRAEEKIDSGFLIYKDHATCSEFRVEKWLNAGLKVGVLDEEGLIYRGEQIYLKNRVSEKIVNNVDAVFVWGKVQQQLLKKKSSCHTSVVGNPRFDVLKLFSNIESDSDNLRVLVNTRFVSCNGLRSLNEEILNLKKLGIISSQMELNNYLDFVSEDKKIYSEFILFIEKLARVENVEITVRPHPGEKAITYQDKFDQMSNVLIDNDSELAMQIAMHDVVIHDGCTTAIEAVAEGKEVFGLRPSDCNLDYGGLPNRFSQNFSDHEELINFLISHDRESKNLVNFPCPENLIANWDEEFSSVKNILEVVDETVFSSAKNTLKSFKSSVRYRTLGMVNNLPITNAILNKLNINKALSVLSNYRITREKFPGINETKVKQLVGLLCSLDEGLGESEQFEVSVFDERVLRIRRR